MLEWEMDTVYMEFMLSKSSQHCFLDLILKKKYISLPKIEFQVIPKGFMVSVQFLVLFVECIL